LLSGKNVVSLLNLESLDSNPEKASAIRLMPRKTYIVEFKLKSGYPTRPSGFSSYRRYGNFLVERSGCDARPADVI